MLLIIPHAISETQIGLSLSAGLTIRVMVTTTRRFYSHSASGRGSERILNDLKNGLLTFFNSCIGKNLAHAEMRLTLAKMVLNFDFELDRKSERWDQDMNVFTLWEKRELWVRLKTVQSSVA